MEKVVGIRFRKGGKIYHFDPGEYPLRKDEYVIVHTEQGVGLGQVVEPPCPKDPRIHPKEIKKIERMATEDEIRQLFNNMETEADAKSFCLEKIAAHQLPMNLVDVEYFFDGSKMRFYFTADGRVNSKSFKRPGQTAEDPCRMRQIGIPTRQRW